MAQIPRIRMRDIARAYDCIDVGILLATGDGTLIWGNQYYSRLAQFDIKNYYGKNIRLISQREDVTLSTDITMVDIIQKTQNRKIVKKQCIF